MTITPDELLETSLAQLRVLAAFIGEQLEEMGGKDKAVEVHACHEVLISLEALIQHPRTRLTQSPTSDPAASTGSPLGRYEQGPPRL